MSTNLFNIIELSNDEKEMILKWRNNKNIRKWMYNSIPISKSSHFEFIDRLKFDEKNRYFLVKDDFLSIGVIYINNIDNKSASLGLYTNPTLKGKGSILMDLIINYAFDNLSLKILYIEVFKENQKAIKLYKKFNFREVSSKIEKNIEVICMELKNENR